MKRLLPLLLLVVALPAWGAVDWTATTGVVCAGDAVPSGSPTIDAGSNRLHLQWMKIRNNTTPNPTTWTTGGQTSTFIIEWEDIAITGATNSHWYLVGWNEVKIAAMTGTAISLTATTSAFGRAWGYGTLENVDQASLPSGTLTETAFLDTATVNETSTVTVNVTSSAGDLGVAGAASMISDGTFTDWDSMAEDCDVDLDAGRMGIASADTSDAANVITYSHADPDMSAWSIVFEEAASGPTFSVGPTRSAITNGHNITGTIDGAGTLTVYAVACIPSESAPTANQIETGDCGSGADAAIAANEVWTTTVSNDFNLSEAGAFPCADVYASGSDGSADTAVTTFANVARSADSGQTIVNGCTGLASVASTSPFALQSENTCDTTNTSDTVTGCADTSWIAVGMRLDLSAGFADLTDVRVAAVGPTTIQLENAANATSANITTSQDVYFSPTVATGDVPEGADLTSATKTVTWETDGDFVVTDMGSAYQTIEYNICDVSGNCDFTSGPPAWGTDDKIHLNVLPPTFEEGLGDPSLLIKDAAMSTISLTCTDPQSLTVTVTARGAMPTGISVDGAGDITGTPTVENETTGTTPVFDCTTDANLYAIRLDTIIYVSDDSVTMPTITGDTIAAGLTTLAGVYKWLDISISTSGECSAIVAADDIISQSPAASSTTTATPTFTAVVSTGPACSLRRRLTE